MKLSKKKQTELYDVVHEEIMQVRIQIAKSPDVNIPTKRVDEILSKLCYSAPQKAIDCFTH